MTGRYDDAYRRSLARSRRVLGRGGGGDRLGDGAGTACSTARTRRSIAGSAAARLNTCWNALDRHVERGRAEQAALIYDSPVTGQKRSFTYRELRDEVARLAGAHRRGGRRARATASSSTCRWCPRR